MIEVRSWPFAALLALATLGRLPAAAAQDLVAVVPELAKVEYEDARVRSVRNLGGALENIVVELKQADLPAEPVSHPPAAPPDGYLSDARHSWAFENPYVRVYDVRVPPGETTSFHRHAYEQIAIFVSGGLVSVQLEGQPWGQPKMMEPGSPSFTDNAAKPITHRLRNDGKSEYHVVLVQFLKEGPR